MSSPMASRSFKVTLSYDGTDYCGWQVQPNGSSIQQALQHALSRILNERVTVTGSGRTDSGVHALGQVASCQLDTDMTTTQLHRALNGNLPWDIRVHAVEEMAPGFHAIRDAIRKRYRYRWSDAAWHDVFRRRYVWHVRTGRLDVDAMREAAVPLVGKHDFASFEAAGAPRKDSIRNVFELTVSRESPPSSELCWRSPPMASCTTWYATLLAP